MTTTGQPGNCTSIQSPQEVPTGSGYVYEADVYFSTWENWPAFWMYGNTWPVDGEIDAVEANVDNNFVTWHYGTNNSTIGTASWDGQVVQPTSANISPGWHIVDIAFAADQIQVYYDGNLYASIPETLTGSTDDPMWLTLSTGSCDQPNANVCANGTLGIGVSGNIQIKWLREFLPPSSSGGVGPIVGYEGLCLDDQWASTANYNPIQVYTCNGTNAQQWTVDSSNNTLQVLGKCLDVKYGGTADGTTVDLYDCNGSGSQVWVPQSDGSLLNPQSGKCLDDTNWGGSGTQAQIWDCTGGTNQQWNLP